MARFSFHLEPVLKHRAEKATSAEQALAMAHHEHRRRMGILAVTKQLLEETYEVVTALSCEGALKLLYQGLDPSFILLDLMMPDVDGWSTYERMKGLSKLHHVPIAIFTSSDDPMDKDRATKIGADDYIRKPCKKSELLERIGRLIGSNRR